MAERPSTIKLILVFTLQSIKSRIETIGDNVYNLSCCQFLLYSPLNQGLKLTNTLLRIVVTGPFLLYSPLNQGLKLAELNQR